MLLVEIPPYFCVFLLIIYVNHCIWTYPVIPPFPGPHISSSFYRLIFLLLCIPLSLNIRHDFYLQNLHACSTTCVYTILTFVYKLLISYPLGINHRAFCAALYSHCFNCSHVFSVVCSSVPDFSKYSSISFLYSNAANGFFFNVWIYN